MEIISSLIPIFVIISIVFSIINKAKQSQKKTSNTRPNPSAGVSGTSKSSLSLQEIIRQQIQEQKNALNAQNQTPAKAEVPQPVKPAQSSFSDRSFREGDALKRGTLEGVPVEMQRHSHDAHLNKSYNEGDALNRATLEGAPVLEYEDKFDLDIEAKATKQNKTTKPKKQSLSKSEFRSLKMNRVSVVNGIIMSEILGKRGGRRAHR